MWNNRQRKTSSSTTRTRFLFFGQTYYSPESVTGKAVTEIFVRCVVIAWTTAGFFDGRNFFTPFLMPQADPPSAFGGKSNSSSD